MSDFEGAMASWTVVGTRYKSTKSTTSRSRSRSRRGTLLLTGAAKLELFIFDGVNVHKHDYSTTIRGRGNRQPY